MFDPQHYLQMYRELQVIAPELEAQEAAQIKAKALERKKRIHKQYDEAIRKKLLQEQREYNKTKKQTR